MGVQEKKPVEITNEEQVVRMSCGLKFKPATLAGDQSMVFLIVSANELSYEAYTSEYFNGYVDKNKLVGILTTNFIISVLRSLIRLRVIFAIYLLAIGHKGSDSVKSVDRIFPRATNCGIFIMGIGVVYSEEVMDISFASQAILRTIAVNGVTGREQEHAALVYLREEYLTFKPERKNKIWLLA